MKIQNKDYEIIDNNKLYIYLEEVGPEDIASWKIDESKITELHSLTLKVISQKAFIAFDNLENINLPNAIEIGQKAFSRIKSLKKFNFPNVEFFWTDSFNYDALPKVAIINKTLLKYQTKDENIKLDNVEYIFEKAFFKNKYVKHVSFPNAINIEPEAFAGCINLEAVDFPNVEFIDREAFVGCCNIKKYNIPNLQDAYDGTIFTSDFLPSELILGKILFKFQKNQEHFENEYVTTVAQEAFKNNRYIKSIKLKNVTSIGNNAFSGAVNLETLELDSYVGTRVHKSQNDEKNYIFLDEFLKYNASLKEIKLSPELKFPNIQIDWEYTSLPDVVHINSTLVKCSAKVETYIDNKALYVAKMAFKNNIYVKKIYLEEAISCEPDAFLYADSMEEIHIPNWDQKYLKYVVMPLNISSEVPIKIIDIPKFAHKINFRNIPIWSKKQDEFIIGNTLIYYKGDAKEYYNELIECFSGPLLKEAVNLKKIYLPNLKILNIDSYTDFDSITKLKEFIIDNPSIDEYEAQSMSYQLMKIPSLEKFQINENYSGVKTEDSWVIESKY
ncbi:leucine-rich repeat protein [Mycoplasma sp. VS424B]|uniref:leucine-rich repeat domain-containing protein n=1 Tax=Mycoplasma sp. VS424B TaxID=3401660 RepID=UPI003AACDEB0